MCWKKHHDHMVAKMRVLVDCLINFAEEKMQGILKDKQIVLLAVVSRKVLFLYSSV